MALTQSEKQKRYRENLRKKRKEAPDETSAYYADAAFAAFLSERQASEMALSFIYETLDSVGLTVRTPLDEDADPDHREEWGTRNRGAIGRAERMVDALVDSAKALAELTNSYKLREIDRAIAELKDTKLSTKAARERALLDAVRLNDLRTQLSKQVRHSFHQTAVKGEGDQTA